MFYGTMDGWLKALDATNGTELWRFKTGSGIVGQPIPIAGRTAGMFATGLPHLGLTYFTAASMVIALPTGVQIFCWIASLWRGCPRFGTPLLFVIGFIVIFVLGGLSGVTLASVPFDLQVHDTYYVVAHVHYVLLGGAVVPLLGGVYFWYPKIVGRLLDERLGRVDFWLFFIGFNVTFFPMHQLGLMGMPRRVYTYPASMGWGPLNMVSTGGAILLALGGLLLVFNLVRSYRSGRPAGDDPWGADTLEWSTTSPPPVYNFLYPPVVEGRYALWDRSPEAPVVTGLRLDCREVLITSVVDAAPRNKYEFPTPSIWPFVAAVLTSAMFVGSVFNAWALPLGAVPIGVALTLWFWPTAPGHHIDEPTHRAATPAEEAS